MAPRSKNKQSQAPYHVRKTTLLPQSLREELVTLGKLDGPKTTGGRLEASTSVIGRKQRRKQERQNRPSAGPGPSSKNAKQSQDSLSERAKGKQREVQRDRDRASLPTTNGAKKRKRRQSDTDKEQDAPSVFPNPKQKLKISADHRTPLQKLMDKTNGGASPSSSKPSAKPKGSRTAVEEQEDQEIEWLEAKLGLGRNPGARKEYQEDGLDDLLDDLDKLDQDLFGDTGESPESMSEEEHSEDAYSGFDSEGFEDEVLDVRETDEKASALDFEDSDQILSEVEDLGEFYTDEEAGEDEETPEGTAAGNIEDASVKPETNNAPLTASKYVPPALRKQLAAEGSQEVQDPRLRRQLLGLLNRLSPTSFPTLVLNASDPTSLHSIYITNPRAIVSKLLVSLIIEIVASQGDGIGETQVVVLSALIKVISTGLVGGMSASGGKELAASLIDEVVRKLDGKDGEMKGKERQNLVGLVAMLYNAQVIACNLVYDLIKELILSGLGEDDVEALLRIVRVSGPQLRHDDPTALKQIIQMVQGQQKGMDINTMSSRTKFMVDTLSNLRNNKVKPLTGVAADAEASLKKYINNLLKRSSAASSEPLRITLEDLRSSAEKGKWWLTGAAWSGNPLIDKQSEFKNVGRTEKADDNAKDALLYKLAKKQGMNTDVRRRIFVALMSSEDYLDACDRLAQLNLTEIQQREIIRVIIHCLSNEKAYNPYYTLIVGRLLTSPYGKAKSAVHSYQITLQFALWDFFRSFLGETDVGGVEMIAKSSNLDSFGNVEAQSKEGQRKVRNLAKAFAWWTAKSGLGMGIFKPLNFPMLQVPARSFLAQYLSNLFQSTQSASPLLTSLPTTYDPAPISSLFLQLAGSSPEVARGVEWFMENDKGYKRNCEKDKFIGWATEAALESVRVGGRF